MSGLKEVKRRIRSIKNTKKITKAMELVSASKMRRAVNNTLASRAYARLAWRVMQYLSLSEKGKEFIFLQEREVKNILVVMITSNRGLCGSYNSQMIKKTIQFLKKNNFTGLGENKSDIKINFISIGQKGDSALKKIGGNIIASFNKIPDNFSLKDTLAITSLVTEEYEAGRCDKVIVAYTDYVGALSQIPKLHQLLPITMTSNQEDLKDEDKEKDQIKATEYLFEPTHELLIPVLFSKLTKMQVYQMLLESFASEQSARMLAMKNATDAAGDMVSDLTLVFNKGRQAGITQEISEISAGMMSV